MQPLLPIKLTLIFGHRCICRYVQLKLTNYVFNKIFCLYGNSSSDTRYHHRSHSINCIVCWLFSKVMIVPDEHVRRIIPLLAEQQYKCELNVISWASGPFFGAMVLASSYGCRDSSAPIHSKHVTKNNHEHVAYSRSL